MNIFDRTRMAFQGFRGRDRPVRDWTSMESWGGSVPVTQFTPGYGSTNGMARYGPSTSDRPDRRRMSSSNEKSIINAIYTRIALDVSMVEFHHAIIDENDNFQSVVTGSIEDFMNVEANIDQSAQAYTIDLVISMLDEGVVAEIPYDCDIDPETKEITDELPLKMRTGKIVKWRPKDITAMVYNEETGKIEELEPISKSEACIIENPFSTVMNAKHGVWARLSHKMALLDAIDDKLGGDKLNMIMQLPYIVRTDKQRNMANARLTELETQINKSSLGIGYIDGTEKVIQLNRPVETSLQSQIEWLTELAMSQICITKEILNGTADPKVMTNYLQRCVGVICTAIVQERRRKLLTKEQRKNHESIIFVQDPFRLIPVTDLADLMDKSTRGAIMSPNEWRSNIGYKPSNDPNADVLANRNMPIDQTPEAANSEDGESRTTEQMQQSAIPLNRSQRRRMDRSKIPRGTG